MNPNPVTFHYIPTVRAQGKVIQPHAERKVSDKSIINIINSLWKKNNPEYWKEGNRAKSIFKLACLMCKWRVDESLAIGYFTEGWKSPTMSGVQCILRTEGDSKEMLQKDNLQVNRRQDI